MDVMCFRDLNKQLLRLFLVSYRLMITNRVDVYYVKLQGSVWGSLKCTTAMDQLNKIILPQDELTYKYKGDNNISIGVLGMVDDNLAISQVVQAQY